MSRLSRVRCATLVGVDAHVVDVEAHVTPGLPAFGVVGLADTAVAESRDRVRAALLNSGEHWPAHRVTVGLSPAALPKRGSHFDLAIAVAVAATGDDLAADRVEGAMFLGELGLDGRVRAVRGVLPAVLAGVRAGLRRVAVPAANVAEARLVPGLEVLCAWSLRQVLAVLRGEEPPAPPPDDGGDRVGAEAQRSAGTDVDLADVCGQLEARTAVEVAAAGHHHLLMVGPPGTGKTMLARRLPGLLPELTPEEALEVTAVHSVAGLLPPGRPLVTRPPLADPHHTASVAAVVGGGSRVLRPGAASCAHRGVLFLDEAPEFAGSVLEALREPLEQGEIVVARAEATARFPARFLLTLAANPCPCGYHRVAGATCTCTPDQVRRYTNRLSGPVRDRIDVIVWVDPPTRTDLAGDGGEPTAVVAVRVAEARDRQARRLAGTGWRLNSEVPGHVVRRRFPPLPDGVARIEHALRSGRVTARGADRAARVAWTLADLAGRDRPSGVDVGLALHYRSGQAA